MTKESIQQQYSDGRVEHIQVSVSSTSVELARRLGHLERELRRYRVAIALLLAVLVVLFVCSAGEKEATLAEIRARRFLLVDDQGRVKAYWGHSGTSTTLQIGSDGQGIRMEHGADTNAIQLITPARIAANPEGFQTNSLTLHNDPYNSGLLIINPGTRDDENSRGRVWLSTLKGYALSRKMF